MYSEVAVGAVNCYSVSVSKMVGLQLLTTISVDYLLSGAFIVKMCVEGNCLDRAVSKHYQITKKMLKSYCKLEGSLKKSCEIQFNFANMADIPLNFKFVVQED
jgi:hypothetical protein